MARHVGHGTARGRGNAAYDPAIHHRRSIRLRGHDYAGGGVYFVTLCVADHRPLFGTVVNGRMALNDAGRTAAACWRAIPAHFPLATLDEWIVMPDHVHGILRIVCRGEACQPPAPAFGRPIPGTLGTIIGAYKAAASRAIRRTAIRQRTGLACQAPASWPERPACVVSGFLSPMERAVFDACLSDGIPMVWILARGLPDRFPPRIRHAIDAGRLLPMTPFDASIEGFSATRAAWCNQYALHLAANVVVGQLAPDGMLACLLADMCRDIPVYYIENQHAMKGDCPRKTVDGLRLSDLKNTNAGKG